MGVGVGVRVRVAAAVGVGVGTTVDVAVVAVSVGVDAVSPHAMIPAETATTVITVSRVGRICLNGEAPCGGMVGDSLASPALAALPQ